MLLIVAALAPEHLAALAHYAAALGMDVLVEIHDRAELDVVLAARLPANTLLGINNRNLRSFAVTLDTTLDLLPHLPQGMSVVTESGIGTPAEVARMRGAGVHRFLVGESLMRQDSPGAALRALTA